MSMVRMRWDLTTYYFFAERPARAAVRLCRDTHMALGDRLDFGLR